MPAVGNGLRDRPEHKIDHAAPQIIGLGDARRDLLGGRVHAAPGHAVMARGVDQPPPREIQEGLTRRTRAIKRRDRLRITLDQPLGPTQRLLQTDAGGQDAGEDVGPRMGAEFAAMVVGWRPKMLRPPRSHPQPCSQQLLRSH